MDNPNDLIGKVILLGVRLYRHDGNFIRNTQVHGVVKEINDEAGIVVQEAVTGTEFNMPPGFDHIYAATKGIYRSRETEDEVADPDFLTQWAVLLPDGADEDTIDWQQSMKWQPGPPPMEAQTGAE